MARLVLNLETMPKEIDQKTNWNNIMKKEINIPQRMVARKHIIISVLV